MQYIISQRGSYVPITSVKLLTAISTGCRVQLSSGGFFVLNKTPEEVLNNLASGSELERVLVSTLLATIKGVEDQLKHSSAKLNQDLSDSLKRTRELGEKLQKSADQINTSANTLDLAIELIISNDKKAQDSLGSLRTSSCKLRDAVNSLLLE